MLARLIRALVGCHGLVHYGPNGQFRPVLDVNLPENAVEILPHRTLSEPELMRDFLVQFAKLHQANNLFFPPCKFTSHYNSPLNLIGLREREGFASVSVGAFPRRHSHIPAAMHAASLILIKLINLFEMRR
jgi:hypothetical protein